MCLLPDQVPSLFCPFIPGAPPFGNFLSHVTALPPFQFQTHFYHSAIPQFPRSPQAISHLRVPEIDLHDERHSDTSSKGEAGCDNDCEAVLAAGALGCGRRERVLARLPQR